MRKFLLLILAVAVLYVSPLRLTAQTSYGTVAGSVTDSTGAAITGATVTVTSKQTGETRTAQTTSNGGFRVESLGTGSYVVTVDAAGFAKEVIQDIAVNPSVTTSVTPTLKIGKNTDTVEVSGSNEVLKTESGEVSSTLGAAEVNDLPLSSLNAYSLVTTLPGVTTVTSVGLTNGPRFSTNGSRPRSNNYLIEGQDNNDAGIAGQALQPENEEAIESVTFLLNSNAAEFGRGGGAISNLVYRSGSNQFHGAVWDRILNSSLNAYDHGTTYSGGTKTKFRENIYGFRVGGPIFKNKLFLFASDQFDHYRATASLGTLILPTAAGYATLKALPSSNTQVAKLLQAYAGLTADPTKFTNLVTTIPLGPDPVTGIDRGGVQVGGFQRSLGTIQNGSEFVSKADYIASDKDKLQLRFVRSPFTTPYDTGNFPSQLPNFDTDQHGVSYNAGIVENHTFTPRLLNELRLSYGRIGFSFDLTDATFANPLLGPTVGISGITGYGIPTSTPQGRFHNTYQLQDALSIVKGNHSIKIGIDLAQVRVRDQVPFIFYGSIGYVANTTGTAYSALANYIDDFSGYTSSTGQSLTKYFGNPIARPTLTNQAYYAEDHWKVASNLAIDLGLRYEYYGAPFNYLPYPAIDPNNIACFPCRVEQKPNYKNFAPRVGFAYTPFASAKTVFRGGFGIFYDNVFTNIADNIQASAPNAATPVLYGTQAAAGGGTSRGTSAFSTRFASLNTSPLASNAVTSIVPNLKNPLTYQYNLAVEQALPGAMSLTLGYVGSRSEHLYGLDAINPQVNGGARLIPSRGGNIAVHDNSGDANYSGVTAELERKMRHGVLTRIAYTYAKALDDVSEEYTSGNFSAYPEQQKPFAGRGRDWAISAFDHRQRAVISAVYELPKWNAEGSMKILAAAYNGFSISGIVAYQSGTPYNVELGTYDFNGDGITNDRPVLSNPNAPFASFGVNASDFYGGFPAGTLCDGAYISNANKTADKFCHVVLPSQVRFITGPYQAGVQNNTIARNAFITPGIFSNDFTAGRTFKLYESASFDFRAECFDCMNHANTGVPNALLFAGDIPNAPGYKPQSFGNLAPTTSGGRTLRFFGRIQF